MTIQPTRKIAPPQPQRRSASVPSAPAAMVREDPRTKAEVPPEYFRDALMEAPAIICLTRGPQHIVEFVNKQCAQSIGGADVIGLPVQDVWPAQGERVKAMDAAFTIGEPTEVRELLERVHTASGVESRLLNLSVQPLKDETGAVYGLLLHAIDVTDHVKTRNELADLAGALERSNRELDSFAYAASHDLRAPLRGIANLAQWIEEDLLGTDQLKSETREMLELMRGRMHRMEHLIEGLLQYSRAGRAHQDPESINVGVLVRDVIDLLSPPAPVSVAIAKDMPTIETERLLLQQVFMNLIGNAIKHANREDASVIVGWRRIGPYYEFSVSDNGPGIAPEFHDRIWGIFQTLEARDRVEGAGIGLALVKKLVEGQAGRVWLESIPGEGATFKFLWRK